MPMNTDTNALEILIRALAATLSQSPIKRAELRLEVDDHEALVARFKPDEVRRSTHVYPADLSGNEAPHAIDAMRLIVNKVEFSIWQESRKPTLAELQALNAVEFEHPAITMPAKG